MNRAADLRSDYERLGTLLAEADGNAAASLARERRILGDLLEGLEAPEERPLVDQLAERRRATSSNSGSSSRRRKSG
jgi:hypothetical protein